MTDPSQGAVEELFERDPVALAILRRVREAVADAGGAELRVSRSQVAFRRRRTFALVWRPGRYVASDVPAVLSLALPRRLDDPRFKEVVHPARRTWMHHLELRAADEVDEQVRSWVQQARAAAG